MLLCEVAPPLAATYAKTSASAPGIEHVALATPAPVIEYAAHNQGRRELFIAEETTQNIVGRIDEFTTRLGLVIEQLSPLAARMENIEKETENIGLLPNGTMESQVRVPWTRRGIRTASDPGGSDVRCGVDIARDGYVGTEAWHSPTLSWVPPDTSPALQAAGCASCADAHTLAVILRLAGLKLTEISVSFYEITHCLRLAFAASRSIWWRSSYLSFRSWSGCSTCRSRLSCLFCTTGMARDSGDGLSLSLSTMATRWLAPVSVWVRLIVILRSFGENLYWASILYHCNGPFRGSVALPKFTGKEPAWSTFFLCVNDICNDAYAKCLAGWWHGHVPRNRERTTIFWRCWILLRWKSRWLLHPSESTRNGSGSTLFSPHTSVLSPTKVSVRWPNTIWFTNLFPCLKQRRFPMRKLQWTRNGKSSRRSQQGIRKKSRAKRWFISKHKETRRKSTLLHLWNFVTSKKSGLRTQMAQIQRQSRAPWWHCEGRLRILCCIYGPMFVSVSKDDRNSNAMLPRMRRTSSRRSICLFSGKYWRCSQIIENSKIGVSRHLDSSTTTQMAKITVKHWRPIGLSWTNLVWPPSSRTVLGKTVRGSSIGTWMGKSTRLGMCLFIEHKDYSYRYTWKPKKIAGKPNKAPMWKKLMKKLILTYQCQFLITYIWDAPNVNANRMIINEEGTQMFESRISAAATEKLPRWEKPQAKTVEWSHDMEGHARKCVERYCELANEKSGAVIKSFKSLLGWQFKPEEIESVGELSQVCSQIVLKCLYLERCGRPDILWFVNKFARAVTKWTQACGRWLSRMTAYMHHSNEFRQYCHVGNTAQHCRLGLFQDSDFAGDFQHS